MDVRRKQQIYYFSAIAIAFAIFGYSFWQVQNSVTSPFTLAMEHYANSYNNNAVTNNPSNQSAFSDDPNSYTQAQLDQMKKTDTDGDGLSDYEETFIYGTSPFLEDTDGDGTLDGVEVKNGTNPLCDESKGICSSMVNGLLNNNSAVTNSNVPLDETALRKKLGDIGFNAKDLEKLSAEELQALYDQAQQASQSANPLQGAQPTPTTDNLNSLSAAQVRQLLIDNGGNVNDLNALSDQQLLDIYQKTMSNINK